METERLIPNKKLSPEGEVIAAYGAAVVAAFQVLINCFEESEALLPGQFPEALGVDMEIVKSRKGSVNDMSLAVLHDIRDSYFGLSSRPGYPRSSPVDARRATGVQFMTVWSTLKRSKY
jgi:hypothetical protein